MTPERWRQVEEIFQAAVEIDGAERDTFLTEACGDDADLQSEIVSLLAYEGVGTPRGHHIQQAVKDAARSLTIEQIEPEAPGDNLIGRRIGAYRVASLIGRGGMGAVYLAERDDAQFDQQAAIKIIKRGMDTDFIRERFLRERQILAGLDHPHIARLLDGGATEDGLPYFVMEYVAGVAITDYCEANKLSITERLKLFRHVCAAVQHAHQKLVAHRDLKPGNILVNRDGAPKLLDFGVAKLLAPDHDETRTSTEQRMLTPDYASPEQVRGETITTAADIYSLGVVLYELLTGRRLRQFKTASPVEIERAICETEPAKPSDSVNPETVSAGKLQKQLAGDLDNIVLMAMRREPERRYESVGQFSEDIRRHLEGLPVIARQETIGYRAGKFIRRHKLGVAATALVILSLIGGIAMTNYQARRAERRFQQVRKLANTFLFDFHDKIQNLPGSTEAREMVVKTALEYLDSLAQEAEGDTSLLLELAAAYDKVGDVQGNPSSANLGHSAAALDSYRKGLALAEQSARHEPANPKALQALITSQSKIGFLQLHLGNAALAKQSLNDGMSSANALLALNANNPETLRLLATCYGMLAGTEMETGDPAAAVSRYQESLEIFRRLDRLQSSPQTRQSLAYTFGRIGFCLQEMGGLNDAMENWRQAMSLRETIVKEQPENLRHRRSLHSAYIGVGDILGHPAKMNLGQPQAALSYFRKALAITQELALADQKNAQAKLDLSRDFGRIGSVLRELDPTQAAEIFRRALALSGPLREAAPDDAVFQYAHAYNLAGLAQCLARQGKYTDARRYFHQAIEMVDKSLHVVDFRRVWVEMRLSMGDLALQTADLNDAESHYQQALKTAESLSSDHPANMSIRSDLADCYLRLGRYYQALAASPNTPPSRRIANWHEARNWYQKNFAIWDNWSKAAVSTVFDTIRRTQAARALTDCDTALSRLTAR
ncbi:MAG: protein kinase domain-containing protein [Blastocatellia bacterium]